MNKVKKQISRLYLSSVLGNLSLTGAWIALLAARGYSLVEIGIAETVFHMVSLLFEIPSGVLADVFGRKKMLLVSTVMRMLGSLIMIVSDNLFLVCLSIAFQALSYNFSSGSGDALAYDTLKAVKKENGFETYESNQLIIYRLCSGASTLCAGLAILIGYQIAYGTDVLGCVIQLMVISALYEVKPDEEEQKMFLWQELLECLKESLLFLKKAKKVVYLMLCNSLVGAVDILLLFFLQAKLPEKGISPWGLGMALLFMELGGIVGARIIVKLPNLKYKHVFAISAILVLFGVLSEHSTVCLVVMIGGFLSAMGDDALQVRTNAKIQDMIPSEQRATLTSIESFTFSMIMIVLSPLAGIVFSIW